MKRAIVWSAVLSVTFCGILLIAILFAKRTTFTVESEVAAKVALIRQSCTNNKNHECDQRQSLQIVLLEQLEQLGPYLVMHFAPRYLEGDLKANAPSLFRRLIDGAGGDKKLALDRFFDGPTMDSDPVVRKVDIPALLKTMEASRAQRRSFEIAALSAGAVAAAFAVVMVALVLWASCVTIAASLRKLSPKTHE